MISMNSYFNEAEQTKCGGYSLIKVQYEGGIIELYNKRNADQEYKLRNFATCMSLLLPNMLVPVNYK